jgi:hypothetical protein
VKKVQVLNSLFNFRLPMTIDRFIFTSASGLKPYAYSAQC